MIPPFNEHGYLPPGIHKATSRKLPSGWLAIADSQGRDGVVAVVDEVWEAASCPAIVLNGSFVTAEPEPNDVDCVLLVDPAHPRDYTTEEDLLARVAVSGNRTGRSGRFDTLLERFFATDRDLAPKGMIEVLL